MAGPTPPWLPCRQDGSDSDSDSDSVSISPMDMAALQTPGSPLAPRSPAVRPRSPRAPRAPKVKAPKAPKVKAPKADQTEKTDATGTAVAKPKSNKRTPLFSQVGRLKVKKDGTKVAEAQPTVQIHQAPSPEQKAQRAQFVSFCVSDWAEAG